MNNWAFLRSLGIKDEGTIQKCLTAMEKYESNHWWEPDVDPRKFAFYQIQEDILLSTFDHFHESIELLLGRPVWTHEFGISRDTLIQEAQRAWLYQVGVTSEAERQERIAESFDTLNKWAKEKGKQVIQVNLPNEEVQS